MAVALRIQQFQSFSKFSPIFQKQFGIIIVSRRCGNKAKQLIGNREIVGFGYNGQPYYVDRLDFPFPAIRWREPNGEIECLRAKECGDWSQLSLEEKKALYRYSFCQTLAEVKAPSGSWKSVLGLALFFSTFAFWIYYFIKVTLYTQFPLPESFKPENREAQFRRMIDLRANPIEGLGSKWDYEKDDWKK